MSRYISVIHAAALIAAASFCLVLVEDARRTWPALTPNALASSMVLLSSDGLNAMAKSVQNDTGTSMELKIEAK